MLPHCNLQTFKDQLEHRFGSRMIHLKNHHVEQLYRLTRGITWTNDVRTMWLFLDENPYLMAYIHHQACTMADAKAPVPTVPWFNGGLGFLMGSLWSIGMHHLDPAIAYGIVAVIGAFSMAWKKWQHHNKSPTLNPPSVLVHQPQPQRNDHDDSSPI